MTRDELKALRELAAKSTKVVGWHWHSPDSGCLDWTVRGPFHRWLRVTLVEERYQGNVAACEDDARFAAAAMNNLVPLLDEIDRLWDAIRSTIALADDYGDSHVTRPIRDLSYTARNVSQPKLSAREAMDEMAEANEKLRETLKAKIAEEEKTRFDELVARTCLHNPPGLICQICFSRNETTQDITSEGDKNE